MPAQSDSFGARSTLDLDGTSYTYFSLPKFAKASGIDIDLLPMSLRLLLENLLRYEDGRTVTREHVLALAKWNPTAEPSEEIAFYPARVVLQDFTGVPAVVDLAAMRDAMADLGGDPNKINPLFPSELVIDHSVQVDHYGSADALVRNTQLEFERNTERYQLLRWGQDALANFRAVPPGTGIVHQVNLEYLARVVFERDGVLFPDTVLGTDSHTTMINGVGVLGWGVGGIEAEAAMLGEPVNMLVPHVVGVKLSGALPPGATATDLVLTITQLLRKHGVVAKFVEFYGAGLDHLALADRATIANMSPEFGSTCAIFPIDEETLRYLRLTGRAEADVKRVEAYAKAQGLFRTSETRDPKYTSTLEVDLGSVVPSLAGPKRPQDRVSLSDVKKSWGSARDGISGRKDVKQAAASLDGASFEVRDGSVVIAAITSCTNTSNPYVMLGAALLAKKATDKGIHVKPWVKTSLAPGSQVVTEYLKASGLLPAMEAQRFHVVGYGCTTCIGNSGPLPDPIAKAVESENLVVVSVLSGNRNFEGRINPHVRANYLASPPLVVAYALAGYIDFDFETESLGTGKDGKPVFLRDIWPSPEEVKTTVENALSGEMYRSKYSDVFKGEAQWQALPVPKGSRFTWDPKSTYVRKPTFFQGLAKEPKLQGDIKGARVLAMLGDSVTTDHISPAGNIAKDSPAARYLTEHGVERKDWNSYGARRGNHEVMMRGTFANTRLKNQLVPGTEGGITTLLPEGKVMSIYDASVEYQGRGTPLMVLAGKEYGSGSSRDWAAKGTMMLGIRVVIAESYERIHRSNLIGMGVLPLEFPAGQNAESLGLKGDELYSFDSGVALSPKSTVTVTAEGPTGKKVFLAKVRIDTAKELDYFTHGGILPFVVRRLLAS